MVFCYIRNNSKCVNTGHYITSILPNATTPRYTKTDEHNHAI